MGLTCATVRGTMAVGVPNYTLTTIIMTKYKIMQGDLSLKQVDLYGSFNRRIEYSIEGYGYTLLVEKKVDAEAIAVMLNTITQLPHTVVEVKE